ncbi:MAG: AAA family ATPase [Phycisphaerales bacterium]|nr:AAA family ATPase [Phycisphaerales bacterium]
MRAIVTGQVGMDKKTYLQGTVDHARDQGDMLRLFNIGDMMYAEGRDIHPGRILDLPWSRLNSLRRAAFKDVIADSKGIDNVIVNTHATFRWRHGLFPAFDLDQITAFNPDLLICLVDNIEVVHHRLHAEHDIDATLKDCMVWREEEILATEIIATALHKPFYIVSRGRHESTIRTMQRLVCKPEMRKVYPSFPMSHVVDMPDVLTEIEGFRAELAKHFVTFDPADVDEKLLLDRAIIAAKEGQDFLLVEPHAYGGGRNAPILKVKVREVLDIAGDIDGQIYMRDFKLIDQSDMIVSYVPELGRDGKSMPGLSSGVERELHHAFEHTKEVYVVWKPRKAPSPFITETATKIFTSTQEALNYFESQGMFVQTNLFGG